MVWLVLAASVLGFAGCPRGGPSGGEPSLADQIAQAKQEADASLRSRQLARLGAEQAQAGDAAGAIQTFALAAEAVDEIGHAVQKAEAAADLVGFQFGAGEAKRASELLGKWVEDASRAEPVAARIECLAILGLAQYRVDAKSDAESTLTMAAGQIESLSDPLEMVRCRAVLGAAHKDAMLEDKGASLLHEAVALVDAEQDPVIHSRATVLLCSHLARMGLVLDTQALLADSVKLARRADDPLVRATALVELSAGYFAAGDSSGAGQALDEAKKHAEAVSDPSQRQQALTMVDEKRAELGV
jgi:hypothetical protein